MLNAKVKEDDVWSLKRLIELGADVNARDDGSVTVLKLAVRNDKYNCARVLIEAEADANKTDKAAVLVLIHAVQRGTIESIYVVKPLIKAGIDVNKTDKAGVSVLNHAARKRIWSIVEILIEAGADVKPVTEELVKQLIEETNKDEESDLAELTASLIYTVKEVYSNCAKILIGRGAEVNKDTY